MTKLKSKNAVITGGSSGIGKAIVELFIEEGANIGIFDKDQKAAVQQSEKYQSEGRNVVSYCGDVSNSNEVGQAFNHFKGKLGEIDILVNCAGIDNTVFLEDMSLDVWSKMIDVHLTGTFLCTKQVLGGMKKSGWGRIINFSSQLAHKGAASMVHYCAAKAGVMGFTRALAYELSDSGVTVNCVNPGPIDTPLLRAIPKDWLDQKKSELPIKRFGHVAEVAPAVLLLASDDGGYFMGASMNMNGGDYMI